MFLVALVFLLVGAKQQLGHLEILLLASLVMAVWGNHPPLGLEVKVAQTAQVELPMAMVVVVVVVVGAALDLPRV